MMIDFRILELLASKICHDIISPVSAINNGVELIEDIGPSVMDDAIKLISNSGKQAAKKLRIFRMAYGRAGAEGSLSAKDIRNVAFDYLEEGKNTLNWDETTSFGNFTDHKGGLKAFLGLLMLAEEILHHGGTIAVESIATGEDGGISMVISGTPAVLSEGLTAALEQQVTIDDVSPRTVHAYVLGQMAEHYGLKISHQQISDEKLSFLLMPKTFTA